MKTIIISGGSSGIGFACAEKFLSQYYFVYNFDISEPKNFNHLNYKWLNIDVRDKAQVLDGIADVIGRHSKIDTLLVSAGKHLSATIEKTNDNDLMALIQLNMVGAFWMIQLVIPHMKQALSGNIITLGSDQSYVAKYSSSVYGMTKAALASLTKSIALDYAKYNIRANCICAGTIDTPLYRKAIQNYADISGIPLTEIKIAEAKEQPIGRIGKPEEVAELAYFLAQDESAFITGALIPIDGGYTTK